MDIIFRSHEGEMSWECGICGQSNKGDKSTCELCSSEKEQGIKTLKNNTGMSGFLETDKMRREPDIPRSEICSLTSRPVRDRKLLKDSVSAPRFSDKDWICRKCKSSNKRNSLQCVRCCCPKSSDRYKRDIHTISYEKERRLILVGRTGCGKSATGNTILNKEAFTSESSSSSVTSQCKSFKSARFGKLYHVVDTPGLFDTGMENEAVTMEILKCVGIASPGPHAILMVIAIGRFTEEEENTVKLLQKAFGERMNTYLIILFTRKDDLDRGNKTLDELLRNSPPSLKRVIKSCDNRYIAWSNISSEEERVSQSKQLFGMIEELIQNNGGKFYQSEIFSETEHIIQERMKEIIEHDKRKRESIHMLEKKKEEMKKQLNSLINRNAKYTGVQQDMENVTEKAKSLHSIETGTKIGQSNADIAQIQSHMFELEGEIYEIDEEENNIYQDLEAERVELGSHYDTLYFGPREAVKREIEEGNLKLLQRMFSRLRECGSRITNAFLSLFKLIKRKKADSVR